MVEIVLHSIIVLPVQGFIVEEMIPLFAGDHVLYMILLQGKKSNVQYFKYTNTLS